jgi:polyisoprenoid-binding protein YceI
MKHVSLALAMLVSTVALSADTVTWVPDPAHSSVGFSVRHLLISEVSGRFDKYSIEVVSAKEDFSNAQINVTVRTSSIDTDNEKRDKHLRSDDFFNAEKYPELKFVGRKLEKIEGDTYKLYGDLTIRDITRPVTLDVTMGGVVKDPWGNERAGFSISGEIDRFEYGLTWDAATEAGGLVVGPKVKIQSDLSLVKQE